MSNWAHWLKRPLLIFLAGAICVAAAYSAGLSGPLLLDDYGNLGPVSDWLKGNLTWQSVVFGNRSGPLGRPIAMATFVADAALWGNDIWFAKLSNLVLHIACGAALFGLCQRLLAHDPSLKPHRWIAGYLCILWMALPVQVSSVLYLVQRMAILSALFSALAMLSYVVAREAIDRGDRWGIWLLWIAIPLLTVLAAFSKENGLLVPLLLFAIEIAWFNGRTRAGSVRLFMLATVVLPTIAAMIFLATNPGFLLDHYQMRDFTLAERLLTEPRILWDYVGSILFPYGPRLGIFHDNYPKSTGWIAPPGTLAAIVAWITVLAVAWRLRRHSPSFLGGLLLYLAGHAMESTVWALELYFEHRNYLPAFGILIAATGAIRLIAGTLRAPTPQFRSILVVFLVALPATYLLATNGRARVWSSADTLYAQELRFNPQSPRLRSFLAGRAMNRGDLEGALRHIAVAEAGNPATEAMTAALWRTLAYCSVNKNPPEEIYQALRARAHDPISRYGMVAWEELAMKLENGRCPQLEVGRIADIVQGWLDQTTTPPREHENWRTRYNLARVRASLGQFESAATLADTAWRESNFNNGVGVLAFQVNASLARWDECRLIYARLETARGGNLKLNRALDSFRDAVQAHPGETSP